MKLTLTDGQKELLRPLIADRQMKLQELRQDTSMRPREKLGKLEATTESSDQKINAVLTSDQQKKYAELDQEMKDQVRQRRQAKGN